MERNCANRKRVNYDEDEDAQSNDKQKTKKNRNGEREQCELAQKTSENAQHDHQSKQNYYPCEERRCKEPLATHTTAEKAIQDGTSSPFTEPMPKETTIPNLPYGSTISSLPNAIQVGPSVPISEQMPIQRSIPQNVSQFGSMPNSSPVNTIQVGQPSVPLYQMQMPTQTGIVPNAPNGMQLMPDQGYPTYFNYQPLSLQTLPPSLSSIVYENVQQLLAQIYWNMNTAYLGILQQQQHQQQPALAHAQTMHHQYQPQLQLQQQKHQQPISQALPNREQTSATGNETIQQIPYKATKCIESITTMSTTTATPTEPTLNADAFDVELRDAIDYLKNIEEDTQEEGEEDGRSLDELLNEITTNEQMLPNSVSQNSIENAPKQQQQQNNEQFHQTTQLQRSSFSSQSFEHQTVHQSTNQSMNQSMYPATPFEMMHLPPMLSPIPQYLPPQSLPATFTCPYPSCGQSYRTKRNLTIHVQGRHEGKRPYRCTWSRCTYSSASSGAIRLHVRVSHFKLPSTLAEQQKKGIVDNRDVRDYIREVWD